MLLRAFGAALLIVLLSAGATTTAAFLQIDDLLPESSAGVPPPLPADVPLDETYAGKPQTILLLGSDHRWADGEEDPARSDTMMLVRLDPDQEATTVLSIPRDLRVLVPGRGYAKVNEAYRMGGPKLAVETVKELTGLKINHVVNVEFKGFRRVVDFFGCIYTDVDRRYYHSNEGVPIGQRYAEIDIKPGYQPLCGERALEYVRFRHSDNDLVRAARQQDFLRGAKDQISTSRLISDRKKLAKAFWRSAQTDKSLRTVRGFLRLFPLALGSAGHPLRQLKFPAEFVHSEDPALGDYVEASQEAIDRTVKLFLSGGRVAPTAKPAVKRKVQTLAKDAELVDARERGRQFVRPIKRRARFLVRFPRYLTPNGRYVDDGGLRVYDLRDRAGKPHRAYRLVVVENQVEGQYYGVQGTTWRNPPLLASPSERRKVHGRTLELFRSGSRLRFVAWRTSTAAYWISNTLNLRLDNDTMLALAASLTTR
jgi:LCP family protein required for cell wall assembly